MHNKRNFQRSWLAYLLFIGLPNFNVDVPKHSEIKINWMKGQGTKINTHLHKYKLFAALCYLHRTQYMS